jgi:hypothetical protein
MSVDKKILEEINRFKSINNYILEQDAPPPDPMAAGGAPPPDPMAAGGAPPLGGDPMAAPPAGGAPAGGAPAPAGGAPAPAGGAPAPVDLATDKDVEELGADGEDKEGEKLDITDLVDSQKNIEQKQEEYFNNLFNQLSTLEKKLADMDQLVSKIDNLETKIEKMRPKTAKEKLELRTLDSGPFNQKLSDFFNDKQQDIEKSGKNEYVLTSDDIESFSKDQIEDSFYDYEDDKNDTDMM